MQGLKDKRCCGMAEVEVAFFSECPGFNRLKMMTLLLQSLKCIIWTLYHVVFIPLLNRCCDVKLCSKVTARWEGEEGPLIPVLLSKVAGVWPEGERAPLQAAIVEKWSNSSHKIRTLLPLLPNSPCPQFNSNWNLSYVVNYWYPIDLPF